MVVPGALALPLLYTGGQWAFLLGVLALALVLKAFVLYWLHQDATHRGRKPLPWLIAAAVLDLPTLLVWLVVRPVAPRPPRKPLPAPASVSRPPAPGAAPGPAAATPPASGGFAATPRNAADIAPAALRLSCPRCGHRFLAEKQASGPTSVVCPACGTAGTIPA